MPVSVVEDNSAEAQGYFLEKYNRNYSSEATILVLAPLAPNENKGLV